MDRFPQLLLSSSSTNIVGTLIVFIEPFCNIVMVAAGCPDQGFITVPQRLGSQNQVTATTLSHYLPLGKPELALLQKSSEVIKKITIIKKIKNSNSSIYLSSF